MSVEVIIAIVTGVAGVLGGTFGTKLLDYLRARRNDEHSGDLATNRQSFDQLVVVCTKLETRVEICEAENKECRAAHTKCEHEHGVLKGRFEELSRIVNSNRAMLEQQGMGEAPMISGILVDPGMSGKRQ